MISISLKTLLYTVFVLKAHGTKQEKNNSNYAFQDGDKWYWGLAEEIKTRTVSPDEGKQSLAVPSPTPSNPCDLYEPIMPDFRAMGQRISEAKCSEYIWNIKNVQESKKRSDQCIKQKGSHWSHKKHHGGHAVGGRNAKNGEFPHMGAIGWEAAAGGYVYKCGSSLISPKFVLTAAHCSEASTLDTSLADPVPKIIRLRSNDILRHGTSAQNVNISRIIVHPQYKSPKKYYDIALMELENEIEFNDFMRPACLWGKTDLSNFDPEATLTGWGVLESGSYVTSPNLQAAVVDIIDTQQCDELLRRSCNRQWCGVMEHQLCAGKLAGGVDACQGDSGGPLQVKTSLGSQLKEQIYNVIGVTSFGIGCALPNLPGIYTRVSSFIDWIEEHVWN